MRIIKTWRNLKFPPIRNPALLAALEECRKRGHRVKRHPRYIWFSIQNTDVDDVLWMRDNLRALDRFTIRL